MVNGESDATERDEAPDAWSRELDHLAKVVDELLAEFGRLAAENRRLRQAVREAAGRQPVDSELARRLKELERERRDWQRERDAIADRIEVVLGKFQWLEATRASQAAALTDA